MTTVRLTCLLTIASWMAVVLCAWGQTPPSTAEPGSSPALRFRRLLVPEDLIPTRFPTYRPMKREAFEKEIERINARVSRASQSTARITRASYRARLVGAERLDGEATLEVTRTVREPAILSLSPCNVWMGNLHWHDSPSDAVSLGTIATGELLALIERDGSLVFPWSVNGTPAENGNRSFVVSLPKCAVTQLILELPRDVVPKTDRGVVVSSDPLSQSPLSNSLPERPDTMGTEGFRVWHIELGGHTEFTLELANHAATVKRLPTTLRESTRYRLTSSGLELQATFDLGATDGRIDNLLLKATPGLHIASAQVGDRTVALARPALDENVDLVQVVLDRPLPGSDQQLVVMAFAPLTVDKTWKLPTVRPTGVSWQEGQAVVEVIEPLLLSGLRIHNGLESKVEPLAAPEQGESRLVQFWQPDGRVEVQLAYPVREVSADFGASMRIDEVGATGRLVLDLQARQGTTFNISGSVAPGWTIDSVQSEPAEMLEGFSTSGTGPRQDMSIRLRQAIPNDEPLRLIIRAHRRTPRLDQSFKGEIARIVQFRNLQVNTSLVSLVADPPLRLSLTGDEQLQRLDPQSLTGASADRITNVPEALLFYDQRVARDWSVTVGREQPRFTAQLSLSAEVQANQLVESFEVRCEPNQSYVSRVVVHTSRRDEHSLEWTLVDPGDNRLSARLVEAAEEGLDAQSWEISLARPLNRPFVLRASRKQPFSGSADLAFMSLPGAASQSGTLRVHSAGGGPLEIRYQNLQPIAAQLTDPTALPTLRGAYRYAPSQEVSATVSRSALAETLAAAWIWLAQTNSRLNLDGAIEHETRLHVENTGLSSLTIHLPPAAKLSRVSVDQSVLSNPSIVDGNISVTLPKDRRFPLISLIYRTESRRFRWVTPFDSVTPQYEVPCLESRSSVWVPNEFSVFGRSADAALTTWDERLFGIRIWRSERRPFDVFRPSDWSDLWRKLSEFRSARPRDNQTIGDVATRSLPDSMTWSGLPPFIGDEEAAGGWSVCDLANSETGSKRLWIYNRGLSYALMGGLLLAAVSLSAGIHWLQLRTCGFCLIVLAMIMLVVPAEFVGLGRAMFLGCLLGVFWRVFPRRNKPTEPNSATSKRSSVTREFAMTTAATGLSLLLALFAANFVYSQETPPAPTALVPMTGVPMAGLPSAGTFNVLSPIGEDRKEKGDYLFLPQTMYDALLRLANEPLVGSHLAWLESAEYHVTLAANEPEDARLLPREFSMDYTVRSFHPGTAFRTSFPRDRFRIVEATLDGQPAPVVWSEAGSEFVFHLEETGQHQLRIVTRPLQPTAELTGEFTAPIPKSSRARLVVHAPGLLNRVEATGVAGEWRKDDDAGRLSGDLFPSQQLSVRWTAPIAKSVQATLDTDVAERFWLHVQTTSVTLQAKCRFSARNGTIGQVVFFVEPGLKLLPVNKDQPIATVDVEQGERQLVRCWLDRPYSDVTVELSFALPANSGLGQWQIPQVQAQATRRSPVWLGMTVTEGLIADLTSTRPLAKLAPSAFLAAWDEARDPPQQVFVVPNDADRPRLSVSPVPTQMSVQENQDILVGSERALFRYEAVVAVDSGRISQLRLLAPKTFEPRDVTVLHDDANRLLRWSRITDQELSIFFTSPLSGQIRVLVHGEMRTPRGNRSRLPLLVVSNATASKRNVNLFQEDGVRVELTASPGLQSTAPNRTVTDWGRLVASLSSDSSTVSQPILECLIRPNRPEVTGSMVTAISLSENVWRMEATLHLQVVSGTIDAVRVLLPSEVAGTVERNPSGEIHIQPTIGERGRLLVVPLANSIDRELTLTLSADLSIPSGDPIRVPELRVLDEISLKRLVVLPTQLDRQRAVWEISGLQAIERPEDLVGMSFPSDVAVYRVAGPHVQAILREVERLAGTPSVHLADYQLRWSEDLKTHGVATFYVEPSRLSEIEIAMPAGIRPWYFHVAGLPAAARKSGDDRWRVPLGPELLPQLVEVLFSGHAVQSAQQGNETVFDAPVVLGIPVNQTLWTIQGPRTSQPGLPTLIHTTANAKRLQTVRRQVSESLLRLGLTDASQANPGDRDAWRVAWDERIEQINRGPAEVLGPLQSTSKVPADLAGHWLKASEGAGPATHCVLRGESPRISIQYSRSTSQKIVGQVGGLICLLALAVGGSWFSRRVWLRELWYRSPHLVIGVIGLAWWLFCTPSFLGLLVLVVGAVSAIRPRWQTQAV